MIRLCLNWTVSKHAIAAGKTGCKIRFASQMWAARPHLGSIFEKLLHRKTFRLPTARILHPFQNKKRPVRISHQTLFQLVVIFSK